MTRHLNGRTKIPLDDWKRELAELTIQREALLADSDKLTDKLRSAEVIRLCVVQVVQKNEEFPKITKNKSMEL